MALALGDQSLIPGGGGNVLGGSVVPAQGIFEQSSTPKHPLGTRLQIGERVYYYCYATGALSPGKVMASVAKKFTDALADTAHAIGTRKVTITASAAIAAGELDEGYITIKSGTGAGEFYKIKRTPVIASSAAGVIELYDGLNTAWATADTKLDLTTSTFKVLTAVTAAVSMPVCVPNVAISTLNYFWGQTWGPCSVLIDGVDGNVATERALVMSTAVAGAIMKETTTPGAGIVARVIANAADNADAEYSLVFLTLNP